MLKASNERPLRSLKAAIKSRPLDLVSFRVTGSSLQHTYEDSGSRGRQAFQPIHELLECLLGGLGIRVLWRSQDCIAKIMRSEPSSGRLSAA